jgi:prepilin-type processing-associated H-X9-DG protein
LKKDLPLPADALDLVLKTFEKPDEVRTFAKGRFELVQLGGRTLGRATHQPGWRWSVDVGPQVGKRFCDVEHLGLVLAGRATVAFADGRVTVLEPGQLFHVGHTPHDSWVVGGEPYVSLHFLGAEAYAK